MKKAVSPEGCLTLASNTTKGTFVKLGMLGGPHPRQLPQIWSPLTIYRCFLFCDYTQPILGILCKSLSGLQQLFLKTRLLTEVPLTFFKIAFLVHAVIIVTYSNVLTGEWVEGLHWHGNQ